MKTTEMNNSEINQNGILRANTDQTTLSGGGGVTLSAPTVRKLKVSAEDIEKVIENEINTSASNFISVNKPTWYRVCEFTPSTGCSGRVVVQFYWNYARENTCMFLFKAGWGFLNTVSQFTDNRCKKIRIVRDNNDPISIAYIDILIDNINNQENFEINVKMFNTSVKAYAGTVETAIPEGYVVDEYDIT